MGLLSHYRISSLPKEPIWAYRAVYTQTAGGGGTIVVDFIPGAGNRMKLLYGRVGPDDYGAGALALLITIRDTAQNAIAQIADPSIDNQTVYFPGLPEATASGSDTLFPDGIIVTGTDRLRFQIAAVANTETLTIALRALVLKNKPTITITTTGTVAAPTPSQDVFL